MSVTAVNPLADMWWMPRAYSGLIKFRRAHALLGRAEFLGPQDITWHEDHWDNPESKFLAFSLHDRCGLQAGCYEL